MKTFEELYKNFQQDNKIKDIWLEAKKESAKTKKISLTTCLVLDIIILVLIAISNIGFKLFFLMPLIVGIFILDFIIYFCINVLFKKNNHKYYAEFKESIIKELISNFYTNLEYFPNKQMPERIYNEAKYNELYDRYYSDDYIEAKIDNKYYIDMAEVLTQEEIRNEDKDGNEVKTLVTIFHGLFEKIIIDKSINTELSIVSNYNYLYSNKRLKMDSRRI